MLTSSRDVFEMPCKLSASAELPPGAARRAGTPRHGTARSPLGSGSKRQPAWDETIRSRWAESPESTSSHQSFWQEEQIILRESCFWRLLNCSWHCSESFNSLENPKHFNIARIFARRMTSSTTKWDPASAEPAHRRDTSLLPFSRQGGRMPRWSPGHLLCPVSRPWGSADTRPAWPGREPFPSRSWASPEPLGWVAAISPLLSTAVGPQHASSTAKHRNLPPVPAAPPGAIRRGG